MGAKSVQRVPMRQRFLGALVVLILATPVAADEVKVLSASALKVIVTDLAGQFQRETGHQPKLEFATAGAVEKRVLDNEPVDVLIATDMQMRRIAERGLIAPDSQATIARVGVGIGARSGGPKPDIATPDALKASLLAAKSVTYPDPAKGGASGIHFASVVDKLGIADAMRAKSVLGANPDFVCVAVANGEVELCAHQISEIMPVAGVTLVGPLPKDLQRVTTFAVAAAKAAASPAALAFARFLARPDFKPRFAAAGLDYAID